MTARFQVADYIIFCLLLVNLYISTWLPGMFFVKNIVSFAGLALFMCFAAVVVFPAGIKLRIDLTNVLIILILLAFCISALVFNFSDSAAPRAAAKLLSFPALFMMFFVYAGKKLAQNISAFDAYMTAFLVSGTVLSLFSLLMFAAGAGGEPDQLLSAKGVFVHPNTASFMYIIIIPACIYLINSGRIGLPLGMVILIVFSIALLFTYSRAGYIGVFAAVTTYMFLRSGRKLVFLVIYLAAIAVAVNLLMDFFTAKQDSSLGRFLLAVTAYDMITDNTTNMLWGYGIEKGLLIFRDEKQFFGSFELVDDPHNFVLLAGIQFGLVVTFLFISLILLIYYRIARMNKRILLKNELDSVYLASAVTSGLLLNNMFEDIVVYPEYYVLPVFLIFLGYLHYKEKLVRNGQ